VRSSLFPRAFLPSLVPALLAMGPAGCATAAPPAGAAASQVVSHPDPARSRAARLTGSWEWNVAIGGDDYSGTMRLDQDAGRWNARIVEASMGELDVRSTTVAGDSVAVDLVANGTPAQVLAVLQPDGTLAGRVRTGGDEGTFVARKSK
jgi:hypothetical protein